MSNPVENLLRNYRAERLRAKKAKLPTGRPPVPKGLELRYSVQLRNFQRAINKELFEALLPLIATYRQDATTAEIETVTTGATAAITETVVTGAVLGTIVKNQGNDIVKFNDRKYSPPVYQVAGLTPMGPEQTSDMLQSWTQENVSLVKGINDDQIKNIETTLLRAGREAYQPGQLTQQIKKIMTSTVKRATLIARDQTLKLNGQIDRLKQTEAGVDNFIWRTSRDERVRPKHRHREGVKYSWDNPPEGEFPGQPVQCRCSAEPDLESLLGPEYAADGPQSIKAPMVKAKPKPKKKPIPKTKLQPVKPIVYPKSTAKTPPTGTTPNANKPAKRDRMVTNRGRSSSKLNPKQQEFDQNSRWMRANQRNRLRATVGERSEALHWEWVHGSKRKTSVNLKAAAKKAFNLRGTVFNPHGFKLDLVDDLMVKDVRAIHKATQGQLAKAGISKIKLYRGVDSLYTQPGAIESWSTSVTEARKFGKHVLESEFDASRILDYSGSVNWSDGIYGAQKEFMVMR